jgi:(E)-4-hydroxy-3-methylbut-2-enyl-diphosphate synthase
MIKRRFTKEVRVGNVKIGGDSPVSIQSMTKTRNTLDIVREVKELESCGCDIVRIAIPDEESAKRIKIIKKETSLPIVADIHYDYKLALLSIDYGADKIRINPGNIGGREKINAIAMSAREHNIPIRVGVNSGSLEKGILQKYGSPTPEALVESAIRNVKILEDARFYDIVISMKSSDVKTTIESYKLLSQKVNYPFHLGVTEAGFGNPGIIKSSIGIGTLLYTGIGDTIRVSLTGPSTDEVKVGREILKSLGLSDSSPTLISCPTCGRCEIDIEKIAKEVEKRLIKIKKPLKIAVMGCMVNGPGEAREADFGITGGKGVGVIFKKGKVIKKVKESELVDSLMEMIEGNK